MDVCHVDPPYKAQAAINGKYEPVGMVIFLKTRQQSLHLMKNKRVVIITLICSLMVLSILQTYLESAQSL